MKLRTQILIFLFFFGLAPVAALVVLSLPMVLDKLELWVYRAHMQNLRLEFGDLHQYLASREEMVRILSKLPASPESFGQADGQQPPPAAGVHLPFTQWINQILRSGPEVYQVLYFDRAGKEYARLERNHVGAPLRMMDPVSDVTNESYIRAALAMRADGVYFSPIQFLEGVDAVQHPMIMRMASPMIDDHDVPQGVVMVKMDVGGLANAYPNTIWVLNDGRYLPNPMSVGRGGSAYDDFPGLEEVVAKHTLAILRAPDRSQVIWMPLFPIEQGGSLWVGKSVDLSDMEAFRQGLQEQVLIIVGVLALAVLLLARTIALRAERFGADLKEGIRRVLDHEPGVVFSWRGASELQALAKDLTRLAVTHARTNQDLLARARELEESNRYKSEFLANMSHELRTPLNSVILLSKVLAENDQGNLTEEQVKQARVIHAAGRDLLLLIDQILELSKLEARKTTFRVHRINLAAAVSSVIELIEPQAQHKGLAVQTSIDPDVPRTIVSDEDKLRQILQNFLSNAIKFTDLGGVTVRIGANPYADADERPVCISVQDTGIGIPKEKHQLIFEAFRQADGSTSRRYGGTGLGLAISGEMAKLMGGRVALESEPGAGSTFSLLLPVQFDASRLPPDLVSYEPQRLVPSAAEGVSGDQRGVLLPGVASAGGEAEAKLGLSLHGGRILLLDDDLRNLLALTPLLEGWGLEVTAAGLGAEALETLESDPGFDAVVMDLAPPGRHGLELIGRIREVAAVPIIVLAGADQPDLRQQCLASGADECLPRPLVARRLAEVLGRVTGGAVNT